MERCFVSSGPWARKEAPLPRLISRGDCLAIEVSGQLERCRSHRDKNKRGQKQAD